ncbi:SDR family NAD(P)-dependent oxidoreductase [Pseudonocardia eucalypti]|uniref:SDR family NAD(P)-dependent oxidoreductase n=1 Tax=Pseudonocardia eucalypti TaxID=648755 RepID=A0ABP9R858_9PSEU|nr:NAD(P)-dependent dehydrogenase (short-subunit alcohol dehydrogenase family) [Pseudonocardia eucalypti]
MAHWTAADIPDLSGKVALVTGANTGLGFEESLELAKHGARVLLAARNPEKGAAAIARLRDRVPGANVELVSLDLADLDSVRALAADLTGRLDRLDLLLNNAGVMAPPQRRTTAQGFELQFGTNHLGHFALTGLLLPLLSATEGARVVTLSSFMHKLGRLNFDDLQSERFYTPYFTYSTSKLANAVFTLELDRRLRAAGLGVLSVGAHPGYSATELQTSGPSLAGGGPLARLNGKVTGLVTPFVAQSAPRGAEPALRAATDPAVRGGEYYGPNLEFRGHPVRARYISRAHDESAGERLWAASARLTAVEYPRPAAPR